jgi:hypothetical protein
VSTLAGRFRTGPSLETSARAEKTVVVAIVAVSVAESVRRFNTVGDVSVVFSIWSSVRTADYGTKPMTKIECENCGRKATVESDDRPSREPMQYCRRCGEELPPSDQR